MFFSFPRKLLLLFTIIFCGAVLSANSREINLLLKLEKLINDYVLKIKTDARLLNESDSVIPDYPYAINEIKESCKDLPCVIDSNLFECLSRQCAEALLNEIRLALQNKEVFCASDFIEKWQNFLKESTKIFVFVAHFKHQYFLNPLENIIILAINVYDNLVQLMRDQHQNTLNLSPNIPHFRANRLPSGFNKLNSKHFGLKQIYLQKFRDLCFNTEDQNEESPKILQPLCYLSEMFCNTILKKKVDTTSDHRPVVSYKSLEEFNHQAFTSTNLSNYFSKLIILEALLNKPNPEKKLLNGLYSLAFLEGVRAICESYNQEFGLNVNGDSVTKEKIIELCDKIFQQDDLASSFTDFRSRLKVFAEGCFNAIKQKLEPNEDSLKKAKRELAIQTLWGIVRDLDEQKDGVLTKAESVYTTCGVGVFGVICGVFVYSGYKTWFTLKNIFKSSDVKRLEYIQVPPTKTKKLSSSKSKKN